MRSGSSLVTASVPVDLRDPAGAIASQIGEVDLGLLVVLSSPDGDFETLAGRLGALFPGTDTVGSTTAGEIGPAGYVAGTVLAIGFPRTHFAARPVVVPDLAAIDAGALAEEVQAARHAIVEPGRPNGFAFLAVDGLSSREEQLLRALAPGLGDMPLFGGSAGHSWIHGRPRIACNGQVFENGAVLVPIATDCDARVFSLDNFTPEPARLVVTDAAPERRVVRELNGAPAAAEYARIIGIDPTALHPSIFNEHPVAVRVGENYHVRAIRAARPDGALIFQSAVEAGMVLSPAGPGDMARHLDLTLRAMGRHRAPSDILACDCLLRRVDAARRGTSDAVSEVLSRHGVLGFCTYGEQIGALHVNHTMTGVALYPPEEHR